MSVLEMSLLVQRLQQVAQTARAYQKSLTKEKKRALLDPADEATLAAVHADALKQARAAEREAAVAETALNALRWEPQHREAIRDLRRRLEEEHDLRIMLQAKLEEAQARVRFLQSIKGVSA